MSETGAEGPTAGGRMAGTIAALPPDSLGSIEPTLPRGLSDAEADARRAAGQGNDYRPPTSRSWWEILRQNAYIGINGPLVAISILLLAAGRPVDALLTAGPVLFNIGIGVWQEARAKQQLDRIALLNRPQATIVRSGEEREVDPAEIVVGDLVVAHRGDEIVVDGTLVGEGRVELDESLLTGESDAVTREPGEPVRSGTAVVGGTAQYVADKVGRDTAANALLAEARSIREDQTPLQREIARTIWAIAGLVVAVAVLVALASIPAGGLRSSQTLEAAAVLVTLVPQGLAIMVTVTYAAGALRVTRLGALVQRRNAVESMSRVDTLCIDKTGTLTTQRIAFAGAETIAPRPTGAPDRAPIDMELSALLGVLAASTKAPNRTTDALAAACPADPRRLEDEVAFSSERRWSAVRFAADSDLPRAVFVVGAPTVIAECLDPDVDGASVLARASEIAADGVRVLLAARAADGADLRDADGRPGLPSSLVPLALLSFVEELRPDARDTLAGIARAGVELKVISGDDPSTVEAIGRRVGLEVSGPVVNGPDLVQLSDDAIADAAVGGTIFGRVEPSLKARLVAGLRARGRYVAMIGDGVNDLLPLRRAHLGVAMESGSAATRGAADLVLLGDAFAVLPKAVIEGQRILAAMEATLIILLARTFYVLLIVAGAALLGLPFPLTPRQNSGLAFVTVGIPLIVLALWVPPRRSPKNLVLDTLGLSIPASLAVAAVALPVYAAAVAEGAAQIHARTVLTTITIFCGLGLLPLVHPPRRDPLVTVRARAWPWILAAIMAAIYVAILQIPLARDFYELRDLAPTTLAALLGLGIVWTVAIHLVRRTGVVARIEEAVFGGLARMWAGAGTARRRARG